MTQQLQRTALTGEVLLPGDDGYDEAARAFMTEGAPALVVRPRTPDEVAEAVAHAVADDLAVSVRSGGHSPAGHGTNTGGMVIDLTHLDAVEVLDAERRLVRVGAGATWGQVAEALDPFGWGLTAGDTSSVGVGGLTLGGGIGWMVRRHGLALDNLASARVVTADGRLLTASRRGARRPVLGDPRWRGQLRHRRRLRLRRPGGRDRALRHRQPTSSTTPSACWSGGGTRCVPRRRSCRARWR